jgi:hypothetical protein
MLIAMLAAVALMADATPAAAAAATPAPTVAAKAADPDPVICKNEAVVGSRLPKKVCMRKSEKLDRERRDQAATANLERMSTYGPKGN